MTKQQRSNIIYRTRLLVYYGTKYSIKLLSFVASNTDTSSIVINSDLGKITFNGNSKLELYYEVHGLLLG